MEGHVEGFGEDDPAVHLCHCLCSLFCSTETDETKALGSSTLISHDLVRRGEVYIKQAITPHSRQNYNIAGMYTRVGVGWRQLTVLRTMNVCVNSKIITTEYTHNTHTYNGGVHATIEYL